MAIWLAVLVVIVIIIWSIARNRSTSTITLQMKHTVDHDLFKKYSSLMKQATALKKEGRFDEAVQKIREAYSEAEEQDLTITVNDFLRLPPYLQKAGRNDEAWDWFNRLIQKYANDFMSLSVIYDKMRLFRKREKAHKDAVKYAVLSDVCRCLGLHHQVNDLGWSDRKDELDNCVECVSEGYEDNLKRIIEIHMKNFPKISLSRLLKDIEIA